MSKKIEENIITDQEDKIKGNIENTEKDKKTQAKLEKKKKKKEKSKKNANGDSDIDVATDAENIDSEDDSDKKKKKGSLIRKNRKPEDVNIVKELLSLIIYIGIVVLLCYFIINFVGCRSKVDGSSMNPTLNDGDSLWVDKLSYTFSDPKRFDVIIFNYNENTTYVKRIIGLPGETVRIDQDGNIFINGQLIKEDYGKEKILPTNLGRANQPVLLGEDEYFVLGDNRNNSSDSRWADVGNVHREDIVGKAVARIYPLSKFCFIK